MTSQTQYALQIISKFQVIPGKKAFQKIFYFINEKFNMYRFQWNKFGPYSEELKYELDDLTMKSCIKVTPVSLANGATQSNIELTEEGKRTLNESIGEKEFDRTLQEVYDFLKNKKPRDMELLASIHYILKTEPGATVEYIQDILDELKPDSHFNLDEIQTSFNLLKDKNLI